MPSTSKKQHNFMAAIAHSPEFAKKAGVGMEVGKHFMTADKGKKFKEGGMMEKVKMGVWVPRNLQLKIYGQSRVNIPSRVPANGFILEKIKHLH